MFILNTYAMKNFLLVCCFLSFLSNWKLAAQTEPYCENYPYVLNVSGFYSSCGGDMGKVCFEYSSAAWDDDCEDIVIEIIYPTASFDVDDTSFDGFEYSTNGSNSILTFHPQNIGDGIWSECFEGELLTANTTFTLRVCAKITSYLCLYLRNGKQGKISRRFETKMGTSITLLG